MTKDQETQKKDLTLHVTIWPSFRDPEGKHRAQLTVHETPQILFDAIPIKSKPYIVGKVEVKAFSFTFKRKIYSMEFLRSISKGKP